jgi:hypothetical protein
LALAGSSQIARRGEPLVALLSLIAHPQPPRLSEPALHGPCEVLPARLAFPPHLVMSVRLLRHGLFNESTDVREAAVRSAA